MKGKLYLIFYLITLQFFLNSCGKKCHSDRFKEYYFFTARVINTPDTVHVNEKIIFQYILLKDSAGINEDSLSQEKYAKLYNVNGRDIVELSMNMSFVTTNTLLKDYPYYKPEVNFTKASKVEYEAPNEQGGQRVYKKVFALDEGDRYIVEYEVSFKDTGMMIQQSGALQTIVCCQAKNCNETVIAETELFPVWTMNNIGRKLGYIPLVLNGEVLQYQYPVYVIP